MKPSQSPSPFASWAAHVGAVHVGTEGVHAPLASQYVTTSGHGWPGRHASQSSPHSLPAHGSGAGHPACDAAHVAASGESFAQSAPVQLQPPSASHEEPFHFQPSSLLHLPSGSASCAVQVGAGHVGNE